MARWETIPRGSELESEIGRLRWVQPERPERAVYHGGEVFEDGSVRIGREVILLCDLPRRYIELARTCAAGGEKSDVA